MTLKEIKSGYVIFHAYDIEMLIMYNSLNEVCHGFDVFKSRLGAKQDDVKIFLTEKFDTIYNNSTKYKNNPGIK